MQADPPGGTFPAPRPGPLPYIASDPRSGSLVTAEERQTSPFSTVSRCHVSLSCAHADTHGARGRAPAETGSPPSPSRSASKCQLMSCLAESGERRQNKGVLFWIRGRKVGPARGSLPGRGTGRAGPGPEQWRHSGFRRSKLQPQRSKIPEDPSDPPPGTGAVLGPCLQGEPSPQNHQRQSLKWNQNIRFSPPAGATASDAPQT